MTPRSGASKQDDAQQQQQNQHVSETSWQQNYSRGKRTITKEDGSEGREAAAKPRVKLGWERHDGRDAKRAGFKGAEVRSACFATLGGSDGVGEMEVSRWTEQGNICRLMSCIRKLANVHDERVGHEVGARNQHMIECVGVG